MSKSLDLSVCALIRIQTMGLKPGHLRRWSSLFPPCGQRLMPVKPTQLYYHQIIGPMWYKWQEKQTKSLQTVSKHCVFLVCVNNILISIIVIRFSSQDW